MTHRWARSEPGPGFVDENPRTASEPMAFSSDELAQGALTTWVTFLPSWPWALLSHDAWAIG